MQDCSNSSAIAMELLQTCTKSSIWYMKKRHDTMTHNVPCIHIFYHVRVGLYKSFTNEARTVSTTGNNLWELHCFLLLRLTVDLQDLWYRYFCVFGPAWPSKFPIKISIPNYKFEVDNFKITATSLRVQWVKMWAHSDLGLVSAGCIIPWFPVGGLSHHWCFSP